MARFFIDRPVFAWVVAILIMLAGGLSIISLPIAQYPTIAPPQIKVTANYPGASAKTVEDSVTQVIEQQMKGLDGLRYIAATSEANGTATITLTFDSGVDQNVAQMQVQNKLQLATPLLPAVVQRQGLQVTKSVTNMLILAGLFSDDGRLDGRELSDYAASHLRDPLSRVKGVGEVTLFGAENAMRIWLDPAKLQQFGLVPGDVSAAVQAQNAPVSAGQFGGAPAVSGQQLNATITVQSRLRTPEEFGAIVLKTGADGAVVRLRDVARVEIGRDQYETVAQYNGRPSAGLAFKLVSGANALDTVAGIKAKIAELSPGFPQGVKVVYPYDTTPFVRVSIAEVVKTLLEAIVLVFLVMLLFLGNFRATLIPTIAVPVVLLGTFGVLSAFGYSINTLTMFAMVLAIGLLVDDAIVVVENVERVMREEGLGPLEATRKSMDQITGALVGVAAVLSAVFVPMAFFSGSAGAIYRQFSLTIASSMILSVVVALVLTPALCATMLKPVKAGEVENRRGFFGWFDRWFERGTKGYTKGVGALVRRGGRLLLVYVVLAAGMGLLLWRMPTAFLPDEDQGIVMVQITLPSGATQDRTLEATKAVGDHFLRDEAASVDQVMTVAGFSFAGSGQNMGFAFVHLKDWEQRTRPEQRAAAIAGRAMAAFSGIRDARVYALVPPAIVELGTSSGFDLQLQDRAGLGHDALMAARNQLLGAAWRSPDMAMVRPNGLEDTPTFQVDIDRTKAGALGVPLAQINDTLAGAWGGARVDDFLDGGRVKKVYMQGDAPFRMLPEDIGRWYARNGAGEMAPFSAFSAGRWGADSPRLERYNGVPSVEILGEAARGRSTGAAMAAMEKLAEKLPAGIGYEWTGLSYEERQAGSGTIALYALSIVVVFLVLAALYESWAIPLAVVLVAPLGMLGAALATSLRGLPAGIYFQVGLMATIGLAAKNAILIVEFAKKLQEEGRDLLTATIEASRMRLRPILMTSLAFGLGVLPLAISDGAGSGSQNAIGTCVLGGTIFATALGIFFVPVFFVAVRRLFAAKRTVSLPAGAAPVAVEADPVSREDAE